MFKSDASEVDFSSFLDCNSEECIFMTHKLF